VSVQARTRVVVVEDHAELRTMYVRFLDDAGDVDVIAQCGSAADGIEATARLRPDVVLIDLSLPDMPGMDAITLLHAGSPGVHVIVVSGADAVVAARAAQAAGAAAYVDKIDLVEQLLPTIRHVMEGA
jgi:DNA-binding NarL/FixJ family response regulator